MKNVKCGKCIRCGREYEAVPGLTTCACGGVLEIVYDYEYIKTQLTREKLAARSERTMWRYRELLPVDGVVQEAENLEFLQTQAAFYAGDDFVMAARIQGTWLDCVELLGNVNAAPGILRTLNLTGGSFRVPGKYRDFAMYHPLEEGPAPTYFGIPFD